MINSLLRVSKSKSSKPSGPAHFILIQVLCSVFAGVYNEYIIKGAGADIHIMVQNVFMYLDSIVCNIALLSVKVTMIDDEDDISWQL